MLLIDENEYQPRYESIDHLMKFEERMSARERPTSSVVIYCIPSTNQSRANTEIIASQSNCALGPMPIATIAPDILSMIGTQMESPLS